MSYSLRDEEQILTSDATHRLVFQALKLAEDRDVLDAARDLKIAGEILMGRFDRMVAKDRAAIACEARRMTVGGILAHKKERSSLYSRAVQLESDQKSIDVGFDDGAE